MRRARLSSLLALATAGCPAPSSPPTEAPPGAGSSGGADSGSGSAGTDAADASDDGVDDDASSGMPPCPAPTDDRDGDCVADDDDNCPGLANPDQADANGNGIGDVCDASVCLMQLGLGPIDPRCMFPAIEIIAETLRESGYPDPEGVAVDVVCARLFGAEDEITGGSIPEQTFDLNDRDPIVELKARMLLPFLEDSFPGGMEVDRAPGISAAAPAAAPVDAFDCGLDADRLVLCDPGSAGPPGDYLVASMILQQTVPLDDPATFLQYGFVFDSDRDSANNYFAPPQYPGDFFDDTDRWYVVTYEPTSGWALTSSAVVDGQIVAAPTSARVVVDDGTLTLLVPLDEFDDPCPKYRMTAFAHGGDYGLQPPYDFSADVEPLVGQPLLDAC